MLVPVDSPAMQSLKLAFRDGGSAVSVHDIEMVRYVELKGCNSWG
jgi:hypothetical protein